jgi:hypothetical protein
MRENSGSETHPKRCKSFSIPDPLLLGYSQRNVMRKNAQPKTEDITKVNQTLSKKTRKLDKLSNTVKVKFWDIQLQTKSVSVPKLTTVLIICLSLLLSTLLISVL